MQCSEKRKVLVGGNNEIKVKGKKRKYYPENSVKKKRLGSVGNAQMLRTGGGELI